MAAATSARQAGSLPVATTSFVGRRREIAEVRARVSAARLVTLTGAGGVGKTRLALEVAGELRRAFADGVWLVDLATLEDGSLVAQTVADTLGVADHTTKPPLEKVTGYLARRQAMLVLDNCEHLLDDCARFVDRVLRSAPGVRVLATSRQTLGIGGEHLFTVPPLSLPDPAAAISPEALAHYDAITLLVERAAALQPGFAVTDANLAAAVRLCAQLDGIPLAIELAAARLRSLSLEQLVERLADRFTLLTGGSRAALPRQQTLRALIDWSYALCSEPERLLWARLSVFSGGFDLAAAEGICAGDGLPVESIIDLVDRLVAQSIVLGEPRAGQVRFRLLETVRQYGRERLVASGQDAALRRRHRDYHLRLAKRVVEQWCGPGQEAELARLRADHGNLRTALETSMTDPDGPHSALELTSALRFHWYADAFLGEGRRWLDQALALPGQPPQARVAALWVAAWVSLLQGDGPAAGDRLDECELLAAQLPDPSAATAATMLRGTAALFRGELAESVERFEEAAAALHAIGDPGGELVALFQLAITLSHSGDNGRAAAVNEQAMAISVAHGERWTRSYVLWTSAFDTWLRGDADAAAELAREGLSIQRGFNDPIGAALMIELLAWVAASQEDYPRAAQLLGVVRAVWQHIGTTISAFGPPLATHHTRCVRRTMQALPHAVAREAGATGRTVTVAHAITVALGEPRADAAAGARNGAGPGPQEAAPVLTRREREVAELVARGMSNRMIASSLVVSPRTVDGHVEHIFTKLGFTSRAQVAAWVAGQHSTPVSR